MFNDELTAFRERIRNRARVKLAEAMQQLEEEERQKRLGPGGLDPQEVMNELPKVSRVLIMRKDILLLKIPGIGYCSVGLVGC